MNKFDQLQKVSELYKKNGNIMQYLKSIGGNENNSIEDILVSYDFQSGAYIRIFSERKEQKEKYCKQLAQTINKVGNIQSILEVGVGEATTLSALIKYLVNKPPEILGFDISWSRLKFGREFLNDLDIHNVNLFTANLFEIPLKDNSIDVVYTSHSIEPNGGKESEALQELFRISNKYLILLEPSFQFSSDEAKERMKKLGYVTNLYATAKSLNYNIIEHKLFDSSLNPLNPTEIIIIEKNAANFNAPNLVCPISHSNLIKYNDSFYYSKDGFLAYPILENIPCLQKDNAILATHLLTDYKEYKKAHNIVY